MKESELGRARRAERAKSRSEWRAAVVERDVWCRMVDVELECSGPLEAHHVLPRSRGGRDTLANALLLCSAHHALVHSRPTWSYERGYLLPTPPQSLHKPEICACGCPSADHRDWGQWDAQKCLRGCSASECIQ